MKKLIITLLSAILFISVSITSYAWLTPLTREEYYAPKTDKTVKPKENFVGGCPIFVFRCGKV